MQVIARCLFAGFRLTSTYWFWRLIMNVKSVFLAATASWMMIAGCSTTSMMEFDPGKIDATNPPAIAEINFKSHGKRLNGILYQANGAGPHPTAVLLHGYPGNEKNLDLAQSMRRAGFNVMFFHYRGAWGSGGDFSFSHVVEDVGSALTFLRAEHQSLRADPDRLMLIGHSMGGFAALQGAARDERVKCAAGLAAADLGKVAGLAEADPAFKKGFAAGANDLPMLSGWSGNAAIEDLQTNAASFDVAALAPKLAGKSILLIAGEKDKVIRPDIFHTPMVEAYQAQDSLNLTHTILPGDHSFSWSRIALIDTVLDWARTCEAESQ